jgi:hypothetical protein
MTIQPCFSDFLESQEKKEKARAIPVDEMKGVFISNTEMQMHTVAFMALITDLRWESGQILRIRFLETNSSETYERILRTAREWSKYSNILFTLSQDNDAEIRITFSDKGDYSRVGRSSESIDINEHTMNLKNYTSFPHILHEFGHALGAIHEHQNPSNGLVWDEGKVTGNIEREWGWTTDQIQRNIFEKYNKTTTQFSEFDVNSIMIYPIPKGWAKDKNGEEITIDWKDSLSTTDKRFINANYPGMSIYFNYQETLTGNCTYEVSDDVKFESKKGYLEMSHRGQSYIKIKFDQPKTYEEKKIYTKANLKIVHHTMRATDRPGYSPVDIYINGKMWRREYTTPASSQSEDDSLLSQEDISLFLEDGDNEIILKLSEGATNSYCLEKLVIEMDRKTHYTSRA